jgi:hypothetical protein
MSSETPTPKTFTRPETTGSSLSMRRVAFHVVFFAVAFFLVFVRRSDALRNPQFYAEEGTVFYPAAYHLGVHSLSISHGGYLQIIVRLVALFTLLFPFAWAPLVMNLIAITFQVLPVNVFLSSRFSKIALPIRLLGCLVYLSLPNSYEINANLTNMQSHLSLLACLVLMAPPANSKSWLFFDAALLVLISLSTPMSFLLLPVAVLMWWKRQDTASARSLAFLAPGTIIEALTFIFNSHSRQLAHINMVGQAIIIGGPNGASLGRFFAIVGRQVFVSALLGMKTQNGMMHWRSIHWIEVIATLVGVAMLLYTCRYAVVELKVFILFACGVLTLALISPLAGSPDRAQWDWMTDPGCGNRYYFFPMLAFLASLLWVAGRKASPPALRSFAVVLLLMLPIGIHRDWRYPKFPNYHFRQYAEQFERAPSGTEITIPIYPEWSMKLTKH